MPPWLVRPRFFSSSHTDRDPEGGLRERRARGAGAPRDRRSASDSSTPTCSTVHSRYPSLVLASRCDRIVPAHQSESFGKLLGSELVVLGENEDVGHDDFFASPDRSPRGQPKSSATSPRAGLNRPWRTESPAPRTGRNSQPDSSSTHQHELPRLRLYPNDSIAPRAAEYLAGTELRLPPASGRAAELREAVSRFYASDPTRLPAAIDRDRVRLRELQPRLPPVTAVRGDEGAPAAPRVSALRGCRAALRARARILRPAPESGVEDLTRKRSAGRLTPSTAALVSSHRTTRPVDRRRGDHARSERGAQVRASRSSSTRSSASTGSVATPRRSAAGALSGDARVHDQRGEQAARVAGPEGELDRGDRPGCAGAGGRPARDRERPLPERSPINQYAASRSCSARRRRGNQPTHRQSCSRTTRGDARSELAAVARRHPISLDRTGREASTFPSCVGEDPARLDDEEIAIALLDRYRSRGPPGLPLRHSRRHDARRELPLADRRDLAEGLRGSYAFLSSPETPPSRYDPRSVSHKEHRSGRARERSSRSSGECAFWTSGPKEIISISGYFDPITPHSRPAWITSTTGVLAEGVLDTTPPPDREARSPCAAPRAGSSTRSSPSAPASRRAPPAGLRALVETRRYELRWLVLTRPRRCSRIVAKLVDVSTSPGTSLLIRTTPCGRRRAVEDLRADDSVNRHPRDQSRAQRHLERGLERAVLGRNVSSSRAISTSTSCRALRRGRR